MKKSLRSWKLRAATLALVTSAPFFAPQAVSVVASTAGQGSAHNGRLMAADIYNLVNYAGCRGSGGTIADCKAMSQM